MSLFEELKRRNVIRVAVGYAVLSWLVLQVGDVLIDSLELSGDYGKFIVILLALGFIPVLVFSWVYEMTPEGIKRESQITRDQSITAHTARKLDIAVIVLLVLAIGLFGYDRYVAEPTMVVAPTGTVGSVPDEGEVQVEAALALGVAVLPFDNLSPDPDNAFFASGVHEDVLTFLSRVAELRVISRTSVQNYVDSELSLPAIGRELGVSHVVEGSVRRAGDRVRVTVQLIDAATDEHVWAENYDRTLTDIFAIQSEIAQAIVDQVQVELSPEEQADLAAVQRTSIEVYDLMAQGREQVAEGIVEVDVPVTLRGALLLKRAVEMDPDYLLAHKHLVDACGLVVWFGDTEQRETCTEIARDALEHMRAIAPDDIETRIATGIYRYRVDRDLVGAVDVLNRAVAERPNDLLALTHLAYAGRRLQLWDTAIDAMSRVVALDPESLRWQSGLGHVLWNSGRYEAAVEVTRAATEQFPEAITLRQQLADRLLSHRGEVSLYRELMHDIEPAQRWAWGAPNTAGVFDSAGEALAWAEDATADPDDPNQMASLHLMRALAHLAWGDPAIARENGRVARDYVRTIFEGTHQPSANGPAVLAALSALAGDADGESMYREQTLEMLATDDDVLVRGNARQLLAFAHAASGDAAACWAEIAPLIRQPGGVTEWGLYMDLWLRRVLANVPEFQVIAARLDAELAAREALQ